MDYLGSAEADGALVEGGVRRSDLIHFREDCLNWRELDLHASR